MPNHREAEIVLTAWRDAERRLAAAAPGSSEQADLIAEIASLKADYQACVEAARVAHPDEPLSHDHKLLRPESHSSR